MRNLQRRLLFSAIFTICFVFVFYGFVGWRTDHTIMLALVAGLPLIHRYGFHLVLTLAGFIGFSILYDAITYIPNYQVNSVHLKELYDLEVKLFGIYDMGNKISWSEWFSYRFNDFASLFFGGSYLLWVPGPMIFAIFLYFKKKAVVFEFAFIYLLTNLIGITIYYLYPAAPPWYYFTHGNVLDASVLGSEALLSEFDRITGTSIFYSIYAKGANVFCAMPSLHSAYPLLCLMVARRHGLKWFAIFFAVMCFGTWVGAVYSQHHYIMDVVLGMTVPFLSYLIFTILRRKGWFQSVESWYANQLTN